MKHAYSEEENSKELGLIPQSGAVQRVEKPIQPIVNAKEMEIMQKKYQEVVQTLIKQKHIILVQGKQHTDKRGLNMVSKAFGFSAEVIRAYPEKTIAAKDVWKGQGPPAVKRGDEVLTWRVWAKVIAPNGQFRVAGAACSSAERNFAHPEHDIYATAETRAKKRCIDELVGADDIELDEKVEEAKSKPVRPIKQSSQGKKEIKRIVEILKVAGKDRKYLEDNIKKNLQDLKLTELRKIAKDLLETLKKKTDKEDKEAWKKIKKLEK